MRLVSFLWGQTARIGAVLGDRVIDLPKAQRTLGERISLSDTRIPAGMVPFLEGGSRVLRAAQRTLREAARLNPDSPLFRRAVHPLNSLKLVAPIPYPRKNIICLGANYSDHAMETGRAPPTHPVFFTKAPTTVVGPGEPITYHRCVKHLDYEVELAFIVGRKGRDIARREAYKHIAGYTIMNDVSERGLQRRHEQWFKGKSLDTFAPMGPCLVTRDEITDPNNLDLELRVNGELKQRSNTRNMVFKIPEIVEEISLGMTLEPGDIVSTGTPAGVGFTRDPPEYLKPGDVVEAEIERIGVLRNPVALPGKRRRKSIRYLFP